MKVLVALGGNAVIRARERGTVEEQFQNVRNACSMIVKLVKRGHRVVVTHGNGPQVGNLFIQHEEGSKIVPTLPLDFRHYDSGSNRIHVQQTLIEQMKAIGLST